MIQFRCWYSNKRYRMPEQRIGQEVNCTCKNRLRIPKRDGGNCRIKTPLDWFMEILLYGGGGGLLGLGLALLIMSRWRGLMAPGRGWIVLAGFTLTGLLLGAVGGERGLRWIGQKIRDRESG